MFDIAFSEILVIAVVALVVLGPEKLPKTARTLGHLYGRLRRYVSEVQSDITREMELDELRKLRQQVQSAARDIETSVNSAVTDVQTNVRSLETELNEAAALGDAPAPIPPAVPELASGVTGGNPPMGAEPATASNPVAATTAATVDGNGAGGAPATQPPRQGSLPGLDRI